MRCPFCKDTEASSKVIDSREAQDGFVIRRRRECLNPKCERRFTTYEKNVEQALKVIKKDGEPEEFDVKKIRGSLELACHKRPVPVEVIDGLVKKIENEIRESHEREVHSRFIGNLIMRELRNVDNVAYVRYASVYKEFKEVQEYMDILQPLLGGGAVTDDAGPTPAS